jgi:hypothetical protein
MEFLIALIVVVPILGVLNSPERALRIGRCVWYLTVAMAAGLVLRIVWLGWIARFFT